MAVKGFALVDEVRWEGSSTVAVHMLYVGLASTNPHDPEVYGLMLVEDISTGITQVSLDATLAEALKDKLTDDHGFSFGPTDTVRIFGSTLSGLL